ncbi:MAG: PAS domain S-box protein, partial [candidate division KSB1 bacterium]|nr:PAS domain S-box protein [candidate division KSB1 bacterium]
EISYQVVPLPGAMAEYFATFLAICTLVFSFRVFTLKRSWDYLFLTLGFLGVVSLQLLPKWGLPEAINPHLSSQTDAYLAFFLANRIFLGIFLTLAAYTATKIISGHMLKWTSILCFTLGLLVISLILVSLSYFLPLILGGKEQQLIIPKTAGLFGTFLFLLSCIRFFTYYVRKGYNTYYWLTLATIFLFFSDTYFLISESLPSTLFDASMFLQVVGFISIIMAIFGEHTRFLESETKLRTSLESTLSETEKRLRNYQSLVDEVEVGIGVFENKGKTIFCNTRWARMLGYRRNELIGKPYQIFFDTANLEKFQLEQEKWLEGAGSQFEIELLKKNKDKIQVLMSAAPILDAKGQFQGSRHVIIEITAWKEAEKSLKSYSENLEKIIQQRTEALQKQSDELQRSKNYYESLISGMLDILLVVDNRGNCTFLNEYGQKLLGYTADQLNSRSLPDFFSDIKRLKKDYGDSLNVELRNYECALKTKEGRTLLCSWNVRYLFDHKGQHIGAMCVGRDITEFKQLQQKIQDHTKNLEELIKQRTAELDRKVQQLAKIVEIGEDIVLNLDLPMILMNICKAIQSLGWNRVIITLRDSKTRSSRLVSAVGISRKKIAEINRGKMSLYKDTLQYLKDEFKISNSYLIEHAKRSKGRSPFEFLSLSLRGKTDDRWHPDDVLLVPIKIRNKILGFMFIMEPQDGQRPDVEKVQLLEIFANKAAVVMENARLYQQAQMRASEMERASQFKSEFLANMSHELRTPLNSILSLTSILLQKLPGDLNPEQVKQLEIIKRSGENLLKLINNLLDLSKIEAGKMEVHDSYFSIKELIQSNLDTIKPLCDDKGLKLEAHLDKEIPDYIFNDQEKIAQVLTNVLSNAVKFTDRGRISLKATCEDGGTTLKIMIQDTGIGMSEEDVTNIFQAFQQLSSSRGRRGTGLGLSISKKLMDLIGGDITVRSKPDKGSRFVIEIPLKDVGKESIVEERRPGTDYSSAPKRAGESLKSDTTSLDISEGMKTGREKKISLTKSSPKQAPQVHSGKERKLILLIDDDTDNQYAMSYILEEKGYQVTFASNGQEGIQKALVEKPDLILMDVMMPGMDGYQTTRNLKRRKEFQRVPIIAMTAKAMPDDQAKALKAGCDDYIAKPFTMEDVLEKVEEWLGKLL